MPRSIAREVGLVQAAHVHLFADASNIACSAVTIVIVESVIGVVKGLLTPKSRIAKAKHVHSKNRIGEGTDGSKPGPKSTQRTETMAHCSHNCMDGQYSSSVPDQ